MIRLQRRQFIAHGDSHDHRGLDAAGAPAKVLKTLQDLVAVSTLALVHARAVNVLG